MKEKICTFCGHRDSGEYLSSYIKNAVNNLIENHGITTFYSGGMGNFDKMCETAVRQAKHRYKYIKLYLVVPYMMKKLNTEREYYDMMYDGIIIPDLGNVHYMQAISARNKWLVEHSDTMLCRVVRRSGGAFKMYDYARQPGKNQKNSIPIVYLP